MSIRAPCGLSRLNAIGGELSFSSYTVFIDGWESGATELKAELKKIRQLVSFLQQNPDYKNGALSNVRLTISQAELEVEVRNRGEKEKALYSYLKLDAIQTAQEELGSFMRGVSLRKEIEQKAASIVDRRAPLDSVLRPEAAQLKSAVALLEEINKRLSQEKYADFSLECKYEALKDGVDDGNMMDYLVVRVNGNKKVIELVCKSWIDLDLD